MYMAVRAGRDVRTFRRAMEAYITSSVVSHVTQGASTSCSAAYAISIVILECRQHP